MTLDLTGEPPEVRGGSDDISGQGTSDACQISRSLGTPGSTSTSRPPLSMHDMHKGSNKRNSHLAVQGDIELLPLSSTDLEGSTTGSSHSWPSEKGGWPNEQRRIHREPNERSEAPQDPPTSLLEVRAPGTPAVKDGMADASNGRRIRYEVDGGVRLAGGDRDYHEDAGEGGESGTSLTLPPPYFSLSRS